MDLLTIWMKAVNLFNRTS